MTRIPLILSSRTYRPLADVDAVAGPGAVAFGATPIALRAESLGATRKPLETTRKTLLELAARPETEVVMFVARDPATKQPTAGMAGIHALLADRGIPFRVVSSPFPGRVCALLTEFAARTERASAAADRRRVVLTQRVLDLAAAVVDERDAYAKKLAESHAFMVGDKRMDAKWLTWLRIYEELCDALESAKGLLGGRVAA
jgi:hypothetical protein